MQNKKSPNNSLFSGVFPHLEKRELPDPIPFKKMVGPSVILIAASIASGEFVLWPYLTANYGFKIWWACILGISIQFFVNMEISRWTLATGETVISSFNRLSKFWPYTLLVMVVVPMGWPGWSVGASTCLTWIIGGNSLYYSIGGLILIGIIFTFVPILYNFLEKIQTVFVSIMILLIIFFVIAVFKFSSLIDLFKGTINIGYIPKNLDFSVFLGAVVYAGAGGSLNLIQSYYIREKKWGMGVYIPQLTSFITGKKEPIPISTDGYYFELNDKNLKKWNIWWRRANVEHLLLFLIIGIVSLTCLSLISYNSIFGKTNLGEGFDFLNNVGRTLSDSIGNIAGPTFWLLGVIILYSSELVILDMVARVCSEIFKSSLLKYNEKWTYRKLYYLFLWGEILLGIIILLSGIQQPLLLLVISACLNGMVMAMYSILLLYFNRFVIWKELRMGKMRTTAMIFAVCFYGYFTVMVFISQIQKIL